MTDRNESRLMPAIAAGVMSSDVMHEQLLQSIVDSARGIFAAKASSIMLYEVESHELVFTAVSGEGQGRIIGERLPASSGIAGWVLTSGEAMIVEDVSRDPRFARAVAERTGYIPTMLMSAPLLHAGDTMGVLNILDRTRNQFAAAGEMQLLGMFANHAAIALSVVQSSQRAKSVLELGEADEKIVARITSVLDTLEGPKRDAAVHLLEAVEALLR
jgi:signal transduction protein with GAF and PtsI domain